MKRKLLIVAAILTAGIAPAQILDTVSIGAGYANENYYTLSDDSDISVTRSDWDLAFASNALGGASSTIRINRSKDVILYSYSNDINDWSTLDSNGFDWDNNQLINSDESWTIGAFENTTPTSALDLGWGEYSTITHVVTGNKVFILKLGNGDYKKVIINSLISGVYSFQYADLDGSNEVNTTIDKSNYSGKNFGYYSIQNGQEIDREPLSSSWDLLFTNYVVDLGIQYQGVTGVLANTGVKVAQVDNVADVNNVSYIGQNYVSTTSELGYDWKTFDFATFSYIITDDLVYFVETQNHDIYKIIFTDFGGSANGNFVFTRENVGSTVGIEEGLVDNEILNVYPNPATSEINITFIGGVKTQVSLFDLAGREVYAKFASDSGLNQEKIDVSNLGKGIYFLTLTSANSKLTQKVIIK